jgi:hypothetical protein
MIIVIRNKENFHYEILESIIQKYHYIINLNPLINNFLKDDIYLNINKKNNSFVNYIMGKYPNIKVVTSNSLPSNYDYYINATIYEKDIPRLNFNDKRNFFVAHQVTKRLINYDNVYFLTPLCGNSRYFDCDILPFQDQKKQNNLPVFIIQGNIGSNRRNYKLLEVLLNNNFEYKFKIRIVGKGKKFFEGFQDKIEWKLNLNFQDFHKQFLDAYGILPLISKKSHPQYYKNKLTSTINYARGYKLKCIIDSDLQNIYNLSDVSIYDPNDMNSIASSFESVLKTFYS